MILSVADYTQGWHPLPGGSWLFRGKSFADERGTSDELHDVSDWPAAIEPFLVRQENRVTTYKRGCGRGLHYQAAPFAQAKLVTVLKGSAQFFWVDAESRAPIDEVYSIVLEPGATSLFTPPHCAHGMLAAEDLTEFLMKMSQPISIGHRGELAFFDQATPEMLVVPLRYDLLSHRDRAKVIREKGQAT